jgi:lipopolysaccharide transport system permease protein
MTDVNRNFRSRFSPQSVRRLWELLLTLIQKDLKVKYKNTFLGYLWSLALPIAQASVFFIVFKLIIRLQVDDYLLFLLSGLFVWQWVASSVQMSASAFLSNASIIKKLRFERSFLVLSMICIDMIHYILTIPVIVAVMYYYQKHPALFWIAEVPFLLIVQCALIFGVSLVVASVNLFFRDMERIVAVALMITFYATPVIFSMEMVPEHYRWMIYLNPAAVLVQAWRLMFIDGIMAWGLLAISLGQALASLAFGMVVYRKLQWRFAEVM